jgi:hypothetical protein
VTTVRELKRSFDSPAAALLHATKIASNLDLWFPTERDAKNVKTEFLAACAEWEAELGQYAGCASEDHGAADELDRALKRLER